MQGYALGTLSAFLSALAAVYTEWVMKRTSDSLYWQNMQLYSFGVLFNALGLTIGDVRSGTSLLLWCGGLNGSYPCAWLQRRLSCFSVCLLNREPLRDFRGMWCAYMAFTVNLVARADMLACGDDTPRALPAKHQAIAPGACRVLGGRVGDQLGTRLQFRDGAGGGQPGVQRAAGLVGNEVCRLHHEGASGQQAWSERSIQQHSNGKCVPEYFSNLSVSAVHGWPVLHVSVACYYAGD